MARQDNRSKESAVLCIALRSRCLHLIVRRLTTRMDEDNPQQESEKPRFLLLPDGCKDLIDSLRLQQQQAEASELAYPIISFSPAEPPQELPASVTLPDPVSIRDLALALHLKPYKVVGSLIRLNVFASLNSEIDFYTASTVCSHYGVAATKVA